MSELDLEVREHGHTHTRALIWENCCSQFFSDFYPPPQQEIPDALYRVSSLHRSKTSCGRNGSTFCTKPLYHTQNAGDRD